MTSNETMTIADGRGNVTLDSKTLRSVFFRWYFFGQANWNYEKMQGAGYCFSMFPVLKKVYGDNEDAMQKAVANHLQFFNSSPQADARHSRHQLRRRVQARPLRHRRHRRP